MTGGVRYPDARELNVTQTDSRDRQIADLQERLTRLSEASLSISDSLDPDAVPQRVLDSARLLIGARYGVITILDDEGRISDSLSSGLTPDEVRGLREMRLWEMPGGMKVFEYLAGVPGPLRVPDIGAHARALGLPEFRFSAPTSAFMGVPILRRGARLGNIYLARQEPEFTREDEETLVMFASQVAMVIDNARRHRAEQAARAALETLIETSPVAVAVFDAVTGAPVSFNREMRRIIDSLSAPGQPPDQLLGVLAVRRADGREVSLAEWPLSEALAVGETVRAEEILLSVPDGRSVTALLNATPTRGSGGEIETFVVTLQDMSPLEDLERLRAEFLGTVSHELRMPLTSIRGSATTMMEAAPDLDPAELRQFLRIIVDQSENMRELIDNLLDVARIETGTLPVNVEPTEVAPLVDRARGIFIGGTGRDNLDIELAPDLPLVMADRRRIVQVIGNLLSNAARNSPDSSRIRLQAARDGVHVAISIADDGRGIPSDELPRLFRKFSVSETGARAGDIGLGLAISKGIVEAHGGRIWAESDGPSLGARFSFTIPALEEAALTRPPASPEPRRTTGEDPVLVVDDDPQTLRQVRNALSAAGYEPIVTADPDEALTLLAEHQPRLVLLDMMLPGYDGVDLMEDIFGVAETPVVFLSAYGQDDMIARAFDMGASDYIVKPFTPTELVARVRAALRRRGSEGVRAEPVEPYVLGDLTIDYTSRLVTIGGERVRLTAKEYGLLHALSVNAGRVVTHSQLLRRVWGPGKPGNVQALRTHLRRLRQKLDEDATNPRYIFAEPRVGYRMAAGQSASAVGDDEEAGG